MRSSGTTRSAFPIAWLEQRRLQPFEAPFHDSTAEEKRIPLSILTAVTQTAAIPPSAYCPIEQS